MLIWINGPFGGGKTQTAHELHRRLPGSVVCDPEEVGLRERGHDVWHFALLADRETVLRRLRERGLVSFLLGRGAETFAKRRLDDCLTRLAEPEFAEHIRTDELPIPRVADHIAAAIGLALAANTDGAVRGRVSDRLARAAPTPARRPPRRAARVRSL